MASTYSSNLKIELMGTGENSGTWGSITNTNLGTAFEQAVVGLGNPDYLSDANLTITITNSNAAQAARALVLNVTSSFGSLSTTRELVVPTIQKQYIVQNNTTGGQSITVKTSAGTGITVPNGRKAHLYVNGTDVIQMFDFVDINGGTIDGTAIGGAAAAAAAFTTLTASGATTLNGAVALGDAGADLITVPGTINSNLLFTDATYDIGASGATRPRDMFLSRNLTVGGTLTLAGGVNLNGNVTVGDSSADTLTINSTITSNLIFTDNTYDIGASGATRPRNLFLAGNATIGGTQTLTGALTVDSTTDSTSATTGSIQTDGGVGIAKALFVGTTVTVNGGTANGVAYLNGSKVLTTGSALTFDGTTLSSSNTGASYLFKFSDTTNNNSLGLYSDATNMRLMSLDNTFSTFKSMNFYGSPIVFFENGTEGMRLTSTGLGIGTSSPAAKLHVAGDGIVSSAQSNLGNFGAGNLAVWTNNAVAANTGGAITFGGVYTGTSQLSWAAIAGYKDNATVDQYGGYLALFTRAHNAQLAEVARFTSSGNLGLGVTPSAWSGVNPVFEFGGTGVSASLFQNGVNDTWFSSNAFFNGTSFIYKATGTATQYHQTNGAHRWFTAPSGTAGNTISFTQAMSLLANGNFLVGTTTDEGERTRFESSSAAQLALVYPGIGKFSFKVDSGRNLSIIDGTTERARIDSSGNLFVGTTTGGGKFNVREIDTSFEVGTTSAEANILAYNRATSAYKTLVLRGSDFTFKVNDVEKARIDSSGNLLVGNTDNAGVSKTNIYQSADSTGLIVRNANASNTAAVLGLSADRNTTNNSYYFIRCDAVGVAYRFQVADSGDVTNTNNSYGAISDAKLKENVTDATPKLDKLNQVRVVNFNMIGSEQKQLGVIAQELEQVFPGMVDEAPDRDAEGNDLGTTTKSVKYSVFVPMLIKAMQEQQAIITALTARVATLESI